MGWMIKLLVAILGGLIGNYICTVYIVAGEHEGDNRGFVQVDLTTPWGADDLARVVSIIGGAKAALALYSKVRGGKR